MTAASGAVVGIALLLVAPALCRAQVSTCDLDRAARDGYRVSRVDTLDIPSSVPVPLSVGAQLTPNDIVAAQQKLQEALQPAPGAETGVRFGLTIATISCLRMDESARTVALLASSARIRIAESETGGSLLDELSRTRSADHVDYSSFQSRLDYDASLGTVLGGALVGRINDSVRPGAGDVAMSYWRSLDEGFSEFKIDLNPVGWSDDPRRTRHVVLLRVVLEHVPFAGGHLESKGFTFGGGFEIQSGRSDVRANFAARFASIGSGPSADVDTQNELGVIADVAQEFTTPGGFVRIGGWGDVGRAFRDDIAFLRAGAFTRLYQVGSLGRRASWNVDVVAAAGGSGRVPLHRAFTGGNRLDPFLADKAYPHAEYTLAGPILRGLGVSSLALPPSTAVTYDAMSFWNLSATVGLPGFSMPLIEVTHERQEPAVNAAMESAFDAAVGGMMTRRLAAGVDADAAQASSLREARQLNRVLTNVIRHGFRFSLRPLLVADAARLQGDGAVTAWTYGGGVRAAALNWGAELLFMRNRTTPALPIEERDVSFRIYYAARF